MTPCLIWVLITEPLLYQSHSDACMKTTMWIPGFPNLSCRLGPLSTWMEQRFLLPWLPFLLHRWMELIWMLDNLSLLCKFDSKQIWSDSKWNWLIKGSFTTISGHFLAICMFIFHKTEIRMVILRCLTGLNLNWFKSYDTKCKYFNFHQTFVFLTFLPFVS